MAGAVVGVLFPPSLVGGAVASGLAGGAVAKFHRALGRGKLKNLGDVLDKGEIAIVAVVDTGSTDGFKSSLQQAVELHSEDTGLTDDDLKEATPAA